MRPASNHREVRLMGAAENKEMVRRMLEATSLEELLGPMSEDISVDF